jgi:glyoxylase-like metal-dependent hydrolase (beta-lactamase superfamily II)
VSEYAEPVKGIAGLWKIESGTNGYLIVRGDRSLLVDCPSECLHETLRRFKLPFPEVILHTQVQEEHCREWACLPNVPVHVYAESEEVAKRSQRFRDACVTHWPQDRKWEYRGTEPYGIGGCTTERPPAWSLNVQGLLKQSRVFRWMDVEFEVMPLPGAGKRAIGLLWRDRAVLFCGDLLYDGGFITSYFDLERGYGTTAGYEELRDSLRAVMMSDFFLLLPSTGSAIRNPSGDCRSLVNRLSWVWEPPVRRAQEPWGATNYKPIREFGRYREIVQGVFQSTNEGNIVLFVDKNGNGLMLDPGPCIWLPPEESAREMHADLDLLEKEAGLKRVEYAMVTHYHGDHVEFCDLVRKRYGTRILATPDVASVIERPKDFRYPCVVDWYDFPIDHVNVDERIAYDKAFLWHETPVTPVHTPGHCYAHASFMIPWAGLRIVCTGDVLQYGKGPIRLGVPVCYNDGAFPRGILITFPRLRELKPDLIVGAHSHSCFDRDGTVLADFCAVTEELGWRLAEMVYDADLLRAMTPPGYDDIRPSLV